MPAQAMAVHNAPLERLPEIRVRHHRSHSLQLIDIAGFLLSGW
jgi:hypothetical protein